MSTPSHHGVVPADTTEICWQMNLLRRGVGGTNHYVISVIRNACGELVLIGAWAREGAMMQHLRHLRCGDSDLRAARAALALTRRKEDQGYIVADPKMLDAVAALGA